MWCRDRIYQSPGEAIWQMNGGTGFIRICRSAAEDACLIMSVKRSTAPSGSCEQALRGGNFRLFMETGIPYTNVLSDGNSQAYLNLYSRLFPKMLTCRMWALAVPAIKRIATRYDKPAVPFPAFMYLVCIPVWLMWLNMHYSTRPKKFGLCIKDSIYKHIGYIEHFINGWME